MLHEAYENVAPRSAGRIDEFQIDGIHLGSNSVSTVGPEA